MSCFKAIQVRSCSQRNVRQLVCRPLTCPRPDFAGTLSSQSCEVMRLIRRRCEGISLMIISTHIHDYASLEHFSLRAGERVGPINGWLSRAIALGLG